MEISKQLFQVYFQILLHFLKCLCHTQLHFLLQRTNRTSCFISYLFLKCEFNYNSFLWPYRWVLFCLFAADTVPLKRSTLKFLTKIMSQVGNTCFFHRVVLLSRQSVAEPHPHNSPLSRGWISMGLGISRLPQFSAALCPSIAEQAPRRSD